MSNIETGQRLISDYGNAQQNTQWQIDNLECGKYYWSVQTLDNTFTGSEFATVDSFEIGIPEVQLQPNGLFVNVFWNSISGTLFYDIYSSEDPYRNFPVDWILEAEGIEGTLWTDRKTRKNKKFYKVISHY